MEEKRLLDVGNQLSKRLWTSPQSLEDYVGRALVTAMHTYVSGVQGRV